MRTMRVSIAGTIILALLTGPSAVAVAQGESSPRPPIPSAGCGGTDVEPGTYSALSIDVDDVERSWSMHVPQGYDARMPAPVWIGLHGRGLAPSAQIAIASELADERGFVVVAPKEDHIGGDHWMWDGVDTEIDVSRSNPDIALVDVLIDRVGGDLCIDLARVYAAGFSSGGGGVTVLACVLEDRIAAVASVAGLVFDFGDACGQERAVPYLAVHGKTEPTFYFDGGSVVDHPIVDRHLGTPIPDRLTAIAVRNGCEPEPSVEVLDITTEAWAEDVERWSWDCPPGADVGLVAHGGGHTWPSPQNVGFSATELVWEFFEQHAMPE